MSTPTTSAATTTMTATATVVAALTVLLFISVPSTKAFPNGASNNGTSLLDSITSHCTSGNFRPNHGNNLPQATPAPFKISLTSSSGGMYKPRQAVTITIEPRKTKAGMPMASIKGFFLQGDSTESAFAGEMQCNPQHGKKVNFCTKVGVTHTNAIPKAKVVCQWTPPDFQIGKVQFVATIVENFTHFWTGVKSEQTMYGDPKTMTYKQKAQQLSNQMMRQMQGATQNMMGMMSKQQGNPLLNFFGGGSDANKPQQNNPFASLMAQSQNSGSQNNPFASLMSQMSKMNQGESNTAQNNPFASMLGGAFGNQGGEGESSWSRATNQQQQAQSNGFNMFNSGNAGNTMAQMANLPASFQSFFQP